MVLFVLRKLILQTRMRSHPINGARSLNFGRTLCVFPYFICANSEGSGETVQMCRLAWAFVGRLFDKYHNLMGWLLNIIIFTSYRCSDKYVLRTKVRLSNLCLLTRNDILKITAINILTVIIYVNPLREVFLQKWIMYPFDVNFTLLFNYINKEGWEGWKGIVATSSVVPRRPPSLRDWDEMRDINNYQNLLKQWSDFQF